MPRRPVHSGSRLATFEQHTLTIQGYLLWAVLVVVPLVFWRATLDIFGSVKAAAFWALAVTIVAVAAIRVVRTGRILAPVHPASYAALAFLGLAGVATATSYAPALSIIGHYQRFSGLLTYTLLVALFLVVLRTFRPENVRLLAYGALVGAGAVALYAAIQMAGLDPLPWRRGGMISSTLGNSNYVGAHVGIAVPIALWAVLDRRAHLAVRGFSVAVLLLLPIALVGADARQGLIGAGAGAAIFTIAWLRTRTGPLRRYGQGVVAGGTLLGAGLVVAGVAGQGPLEPFIRAGRSFWMRSHDLLAAWNIFRDHPIRGVGFDRYGGYYHSHRAAEATHYQRLDHTASTPHSEHVNMFVSGGLPLGIAYLVFVAIIAWVLLRAIRDLEGERLLLAGGLGGAWVAYQAVSLISINVPSLASTGWVLTGAALVAADPPTLRTWWLPWVGPPVEGKSQEARRARGRRAVTRKRVAVPAMFAIGLAGVGALWGVWLFVKADVHAKDSDRLRTAGEAEIAVLAGREAYRLNPVEPRYGTVLSRALIDAGDVEGALELVEDTVERNPRNIGPVITAARLSEQVGDMERAEVWFRRAIELEPNDPTLATEAGRFFLRIDEYEIARERYEHAVSLVDDRSEWWVRLGYAREHTGDEEGAREAYEQALELDPDDSEARSQLARLDGDA